MLPYASIKAACDSVSFPRVAGEGWDGGQRAEDKNMRRALNSVLILKRQPRQ